MSNNKQTAVEWLVDQLKERGYAGEFPPHLLFEQAKEMHKEELLNIFNCGRNFQATGEGTFNEIYNEIYGKDNIDNSAV